MFHNRSAHPVDLSIPPDGLMEGIDHDDLEVLVSGILAHPVRVQNTQSLDAATHTLFGDGLQVAHGLLLLDRAGSFGFTVRTALGDGPFAASTTHSDAVDNKTLLVLVSQTPGLIGTGGPGDAVDLGQLAVLPTADTQKVAHDITLLLAVQLRHVLVRAHLETFLRL